MPFLHRSAVILENRAFGFFSVKKLNVHWSSSEESMFLSVLLESPSGDPNTVIFHQKLRISTISTHFGNNWEVNPQHHFWVKNTINFCILSLKTCYYLHVRHFLTLYSQLKETHFLSSTNNNWEKKWLVKSNSVNLQYFEKKKNWDITYRRIVSFFKIMEKTSLLGKLESSECNQRKWRKCWDIEIFEI